MVRTETRVAIRLVVRIRMRFPLPIQRKGGGCQADSVSVGRHNIGLLLVFDMTTQCHSASLVVME